MILPAMILPVIVLAAIILVVMMFDRPLMVGRCVGFLFLILAELSGAVAADKADSLRGSFAERDITPEIGMERPGGYGKAFHDSIHDPCKVRVAVMDDGERQVAIVSVDALLVRRSLVQAARKRIQEATGMAGESVLIHATHSHSSGPTGMIYPGEYDHASDQIQELAYAQSSTANLAFVAHVEDQIVDAVVEAFEKRSTCLMNFGVGHESRVAFNRRFLMSNGITQTHPRPGNPEIVKVAGPTDPDVGVIGVWDQSGQLAGCIVNFSCHATTNPPGASANYVFFVEQVLRGVFGKQCVLVFLAGASGDVTQVENETQYEGRPAIESARFVGGCIGAEAVKVLLRQPTTKTATVAFDSAVLKIPRRKPSSARLAKSRELIAKDPNDVANTNRTFAKELLLLEARLQSEPVAEAEVQAIQVGPVVMLTDPAELFCQLGLNIKKGSKFPMTFPVSLSNGCVGYVPTTDAFGPNGGGYETRLTSYSNLQINAGDLMVEKAVELSRRMTPDLMPTRAKAKPYRNNAWSYGAVGPEKE